MKKVILLITIVFLLSGSGISDLKLKEGIQEERETNFQACRDLGGIPIKSYWDGRLARCEFPPK